MLLRPRAAVGRHQGESGRGVTSKAPLAHLVGGSGRSEVSPTAILQDTHSLEGEFCELRLVGCFRTSHCRISRKFTSSIMHSPGPVRQSVLRRVSKVHDPVYIRH